MNYLIIATLLITNIYSYIMYKEKRDLAEYYRWKDKNGGDTFEMD